MERILRPSYKFTAGVGNYVYAFETKYSIALVAGGTAGYAQAHS